LRSTKNVGWSSFVNTTQVVGDDIMADFIQVIGKVYAGKVADCVNQIFDVLLFSNYIYKTSSEYLKRKS